MNPSFEFNKLKPFRATAMRTAYFLSKLENFALWLLFRSPRVGFICVKQMNSPVVWYCQDPNDLALEHEMFESPAHYFERMYHSPAYREDE